MTTDKKQTKSQRIATLERQLIEAKAGQSHVYHSAESAVNKIGTNQLTGSGVVLTLTVLGGREVCAPVLIRDGLSDELIAALKADFKRSFDLATLYKPKGI